PVHLDVQTRGQGVHHGGAHTVQTTGGRIGAAPELASGVQLGEDHLDTAETHVAHGVHRDAAAVVAHLHGLVRVQDDLDRVPVAFEGFVHGVVDDLPQAVHQPTGVGGPDVHPGSLPYGFQALEHGQVPGGVAGFGGGLRHGSTLGAHRPAAAERHTFPQGSLRCCRSCDPGEPP